jgi:hypothetical protein
MSDDVPQEALVNALERVLPPMEERREMSDDEFAQVVVDGLDDAKRILRSQGYDLSKSGEATPQDLLKSIYSDAGTTQLFDSETASLIESAFSRPDVEASSDSPPLSVHYGKSVDTPASSNLGDTAHNSGNQASDE